MAIRRGRKPGTFAVEFQQGGVRVFRRLPPGITQAQAREYETKIRRELFDRGPLGRKEALTITAAIGLWLQSNRRKNQRQAESEARQWAPFVEGRLLQEAPEVAQEAVTAWNGRMALATREHGSTQARTRPRPQARREASAHGSRTAHTSSPATINRRLALLKAVCKHAWKQGLIAENLSGRISLLREDNKREVYLTRAEVLRLTRSSTSEEVRSAIMIAAYTGLRASELLAITPGDLHKDSLTVRQSKTGKPRVVPVAAPIRGLFRALPLGLSYWQLHKQFGVARRKAGMPHVQFHDLRHTCASWLINEGVDLYTVGRILGHSGPATTARYAHLSTQTLEKAMRRLK